MGPRVVALDELPARNPAALLRHVADALERGRLDADRVVVICQHAGPPVTVCAAGPGDALTFAGLCLAGAHWLVAE